MAFNLAPVPPGRSQAHRQLQQQPGPAQFHQPLGGGYGAYGQFPGSPGHQFGGAPQQFAPAGGRPQGGRMVPQQFAAPMNLPQTPQSPQSPPGWNSWDSPGSSQPFGPLSPGNSMLMSPHSGQVMSPQQHPWRFGGQLDQDTEMAPWFLSGVPRDQVRKRASRMQKHGGVGSFLVRDVESSPGCYGLCVKNEEGKLSNYMIERVAYPRHPSGVGFNIRGAKTTFPTVAELIHYHSEMPRKPLRVALVGGAMPSRFGGQYGYPQQAQRGPGPRSPKKRSPRKGAGSASGLEEGKAKKINTTTKKERTMTLATEGPRQPSHLARGGVVPIAADFDQRATAMRVESSEIRGKKAGRNLKAALAIAQQAKHADDSLDKEIASLRAEISRLTSRLALASKRSEATALAAQVKQLNSELDALEKLNQRERAAAEAEIREASERKAKLSAWEIPPVAAAGNSRVEEVKRARAPKAVSQKDISTVLKAPVRPRKTYTVLVRTGTLINASTDANIKLQITGELGKSRELELADSKTNKDKFEAGQTDVFVFEMEDLGMLLSLRLVSDNKRGLHLLHPEWYLEAIDVSCSDGMKWKVKCNRWFDKKRGLEHSFPATHVALVDTGFKVEEQDDEIDISDFEDNGPEEESPLAPAPAAARSPNPLRMVIDAAAGRTPARGPTEASGDAHVHSDREGSGHGDGGGDNADADDNSRGEQQVLAAEAALRDPALRPLAIGTEVAEVVAAVAEREMVLDTVEERRAAAATFIAQRDREILLLRERQSTLEEMVQRETQRAANLIAEKSSMEKTVAGNDLWIEKLQEAQSITKAVLVETQAQIEATAAEAKSSESIRDDTILKIEAIDTAEARARAALIENEDRLVDLLVEEEELKASLALHEMETAANLARLALEAERRSEVNRDFAMRNAKKGQVARVFAEGADGGDGGAEAEAKAEASAPVDAKANTEAALQGMSRDVAALEHSLKVAERQLKFAETSHALIGQYPEAARAVLEERAAYEKGDWRRPTEDDLLEDPDFDLEKFENGEAAMAADVDNNETFGFDEADLNEYSQNGGDGDDSRKPRRLSGNKFENLRSMWN